MEITVKIEKILEPQSFVSRTNGNTYVTHVFVGETTNTQYPKMVAFKVMGNDRMANMAIVVGGTYNVSFDVESREWQGKYFTECQAWRAVRVDNQPQQQASAPAPQPQPIAQQANNNNNNADDVPF